MNVIIKLIKAGKRRNIVMTKELEGTEQVLGLGIVFLRMQGKKKIRVDMSKQISLVLPKYLVGARQF